MKRLLVVAAALAALTFAQAAGAATTCPAWPIVVNVYQSIENGPELGASGNVWARSDYTRLLRVVRSGNWYCAYSNFSGTLSTLQGPSPAGTGWVGDGVP